jgi:hypothetical protein
MVFARHASSDEGSKGARPVGGFRRKAAPLSATKRAALAALGAVEASSVHER